mgnify:CR=1 FL=1
MRARSKDHTTRGASRGARGFTISHIHKWPISLACQRLSSVNGPSHFFRPVHKTRISVSEQWLNFSPLTPHCKLIAR